jgi:D-arabinose 1-dehydrogenase-like Zn-dependent alcohol dehydrogenase
LVAILGIGGLGHLAVQFASKFGFRTIAIGRGAEKGELARRLGADAYINSTATNPAEALIAMGGAKVILSTAPNSKANADLLGGLGPNGKLILLAGEAKPLEVAPQLLIQGRRSLQGWTSGHARDSEDALAFAALRGVKPTIELFPLEQAEEAYQRMAWGKVRFRAVLTI